MQQKAQQTFMYILDNPFPIRDKGGRKRVHNKSQIGDGCLTHLSLMRDRSDRELARLLLKE
jgi:hypothetical protein